MAMVGDENNTENNNNSKTRPFPFSGGGDINSDKQHNNGTGTGTGTGTGRGEDDGSTEYSIDLSALPLSPVEEEEEDEKCADNDGRLALRGRSKSQLEERRLPQAETEAENESVADEIGGPTDFTQDMEFWMNASLNKMGKAGAGAGAGASASANNGGSGILDGLLEGEVRMPGNYELDSFGLDGGDYMGGNFDFGIGTRESELERMFNDDGGYGGNGNDHDDDEDGQHEISVLSADGQHGTILSPPRKADEHTGLGVRTNGPALLPLQPTIEDVEDSTFRPNAQKGGNKAVEQTLLRPEVFQNAIEKLRQMNAHSNAPIASPHHNINDQILADEVVASPYKPHDEHQELWEENICQPYLLQQQPDFAQMLGNIKFQLSNLQAEVRGQHQKVADSDQKLPPNPLQAQEQGFELRIATLQARLEQSQSDAHVALIAARSSHKAALEREKMQYDDKIADLRHTNAVLQRQLRDSQKDAEEHLAWELVRAEKQRKREIEIVESEGYENSLTLNSKLRKAEAELRSTKVELSEAELKMNSLKEQLDRVKALSLKDQRQALTPLKDVVQAQFEKDSSTSKFGKANDAVDENISDSRAERHQYSSSAQGFAGKPGLENVDEDIEDENLENKVRIPQLEREIAAIRADTDVRVEDMRRRAEVAVSKTAELLSKQKEETRTANEARDAAIADNETLKKKLADQNQTLVTVKLAIDRLKVSSRKQEEDLCLAHADLQNAYDQNKVLRDDFDAVNRIVDERMIAAAKEREKLWKQKLAKVKGERRELGRALLREWGKEECGNAGIDNRQMYNYHYVKKAVEVG